MQRHRIATAFVLVALVVTPHTSRADWLDDLIEGWQRARAIDAQARRVYGPAVQALDGVNRAVQGDPIASDNEWINRIRQRIGALNAEIGPQARRTANDWIAWSGMNAFSIQQTTAAVRRLQAERERFQRIDKQCDVLRTTVVAVNVADHLDIRSAGRNLTSVKWLDIEARKEAISQLDRCRNHAQAAASRLESVINLVTKTRDEMIRNREQFNRMQGQGQPFSIPKAASPRGPSSSSTQADRSAATLAQWKQVPAASAASDFTRPLHDPLAAETEYSAPSGPSHSGLVMRSGPAGGLPAFSSGYWSGSRSGSGGSSSGGHYSGYAPPTGRGGGWDNLYPGRATPTPSASTAPRNPPLTIVRPRADPPVRHLP